MATSISRKLLVVLTDEDCISDSSDPPSCVRLTLLVDEYLLGAWNPVLGPVCAKFTSEILKLAYQKINQIFDRNQCMFTHTTRIRAILRSSAPSSTPPASGPSMVRWLESQPSPSFSTILMSFADIYMQNGCTCEELLNTINQGPTNI